MIIELIILAIIIPHHLLFYKLSLCISYIPSIGHTVICIWVSKSGYSHLTEQDFSGCILFMESSRKSSLLIHQSIWESMLPWPIILMPTSCMTCHQNVWYGDSSPAEPDIYWLVLQEEAYGWKSYLWLRAYGSWDMCWTDYWSPL